AGRERHNELHQLRRIVALRGRGAADRKGRRQARKSEQQAAQQFHERLPVFSWVGCGRIVAPEGCDTRAPFGAAGGLPLGAHGPFSRPLNILDQRFQPESEHFHMMRTEQARPIRLEDYRPPDWRVETVELDVALDPTSTKVRATLKMTPRSEAAPAPIVLDGDGLTLTS